MNKTPFPASYIPTKQNGRRLQDQFNFEYNVVRKRDSKTYYACKLKKKEGCTAVATVENASDCVIKLSGFHNHDSMLIDRRVKQQENVMIEVAKAAPGTNTVRKLRDSTLGAYNRDTDQNTSRNIKRSGRAQELHNIVTNYQAVSKDQYMKNHLLFFNATLF